MTAPQSILQHSPSDTSYGFHKSRESTFAEVIATLTSGRRQVVPLAYHYSTRGKF